MSGQTKVNRKKHVVHGLSVPRSEVVFVYFCPRALRRWGLLTERLLYVEFALVRTYAVPRAVTADEKRRAADSARSRLCSLPGRYLRAGRRCILFSSGRDGLDV
jgi:hypothetical protein